MADKRRSVAWALCVLALGCGSTTADPDRGDAGSTTDAAPDAGSDGADAGDAAEVWCPNGGLPHTECYSMDEFPYEGKTITVTKCLDKTIVTDKCCVPASHGPMQNGTVCCYVFCKGPCFCI